MRARRSLPLSSVHGLESAKGASTERGQNTGVLPWQILGNLVGTASSSNRGKVKRVQQQAKNHQVRSSRLRLSGSCGNEQGCLAAQACRSTFSTEWLTSSPVAHVD